MSAAALELFERACAHDRAGREDEAAPCYERALLGLGSTYRNLGRHGDAIGVLEAAVAEYPDRDELRLFLALALRSGGREREAFRVLGGLVLDRADLHGYERAAAYYLDHLDEP